MSFEDMQFCPTYTENELDPRLLGIMSLNPFVMHDSPSRLQMFGSHIGQTLVVNGSTVRRTVSGTERKFGKHTPKIMFPCNAAIVSCVQLYPKVLTGNPEAFNPLVAIIYENLDSPTREVDILYLPYHNTTHKDFGFVYKVNPNVINRLVPGAHIPYGTVIADSPNIAESGDYKYGTGLNIALISDPAGIEDGAVISTDAVKKLTTRGFGVRTMSFGTTAIPLNINGNYDRYKIIPDIGERIRGDGILMGTRIFDEKLSPSMVSRRSLRKTNHFDKLVYGVPGAKIIDVLVHRGNHNKPKLPHGMESQCSHYYRRSLSFHENIIKTYETYKRSNGSQINLSPKLHRQVVESIAVTSINRDSRINPIFDKSTLDEWLIQVTFEYEIVPTIGFKITDTHGGKGVICAIRPTEDMPIDMHGNRAHVIMDDQSTTKRMNFGRLYEQYFTASAHATTQRIRTLMSDQAMPIDIRYETCTNLLLRFYDILCPIQSKTMRTTPKFDFRRHIDTVVIDGIYMFMPTNNPVDYLKAVTLLSKEFPACYGPITYRDMRGQMVTTINNVLIGELYIILLEKIGNAWSAVSSAKLQHHGLPAKITHIDKYSNPGRTGSTRTLGEGEARAFAAYCGGDTAARLHSQTICPPTHRNILENILNSDRPTDIEYVVDHNAFPHGKGRILTNVHHILECGGAKFVKGNE